MIEKKGLNTGVICRFLDRLMVGSPKIIFLIWDGHPIHKSRKVAQKVQSYEGKLRLVLLPGYSPERNPDEGVCREAKSHRMGRAGVFTLTDMKSKALGALHHLARRPDKIRRFFPTASTRYAV